MKYYLLSGMDERDGYKFFSNIAKILKEELKVFDTIIYIPTYPDNKEKCEKLSKSEKLNNIGINIKKSIVLDYSYTKEKVKKIIKENELFFLYGGNPYKQIEFLNSYNMEELLRDKIIIALSAGSINMSKKAICTRDEEFEVSNMYKGLGLVKFSIEPHFTINDKGVLEDLLRFSYSTNIYALEDNAFIIIDNDETNFYGNVYQIKNGHIKIKNKGN